MNLDAFSKFITNCTETFYPEPINPSGDMMTKQAVDSLHAVIPLGSKVLDVGCGNGGACRALRDLGHIPTGLSANDDEVAKLKADNIEAVQMDMHDIGPPLGPFAAVITKHVLEHSPVPLFVLKQIYEITAPEGWIYVEVPAPDTICRHETNPNHYTVMGMVAWGNIIDRAGFKVKKHSAIPIATSLGPDVYFWFLAQK